MTIDPRYQKLAKQLVHYSCTVQAGEKVMLDLAEVPDALGVALIREIRAVGADPLVRVIHTALNKEMLTGATESQYELINELDVAQFKAMDAYIAFRGSHNIAELSSVPAENMKLAMKALRPSMNERVNGTKWVVLRWPTPAMAQQAGMSTGDFEDYFFKVCTYDYASLLPGMEFLKALMNKTDKVEIKGPGTHLTFSIKDIPAIECCGLRNIPDGEVFTAPVKDSVEGVVSYNAPSIYQGIAFDDVVLTFEKGKIVDAQAGQKTAALNRILDSDEGSRYIGEFALGVNPVIQQPIRDILFDEKIGGSFHFTPGQAYEVADNGNRSQVHWDLVCMQTEACGGGEIYFDGELIRKNGLFLAPELASLNPAE